MAIDKVREYFKTYQMDDHILEFDVSSATVELQRKLYNVKENVLLRLCPS